MRFLARSIRPFVLIVALALSAPAQAGAGAPGGYLRHFGAVLGNNFEVDFGAPGVNNGVALLGISDGYGPQSHPLLGTVWFDFASAAYAAIPFPLDSNGNVHLEGTIPADPSLYFLPPLYLHGFVYDQSGLVLSSPPWTLSKTVRINFETLDGFRPVGSMSEPRALHTATPLGTGAWDDETRVLIAGGGTGTIILPVPSATTEIYNPMKRAFDPGPTMAAPRIGHQAVRLADGRVLICGGSTTGGACLATCEIFDPESDSLLPAASMNAPRSCHQATLLPDGRVLVTGGLADWTAAAADFVGRLNTAQNTAEVYDPATGTWTPLAQTMASRRAGHRQVLLDDGRVLIVAGISGGSAFVVAWQGSANIPVHTGTCDLFDPATNLLTPGPATQGRAFFGVSRLQNGTLLMTGGTSSTGQNGAAAADSRCFRLEPAPSSTWVETGVLTTGLCFHSQTASAFNGDAIIMGGFTGDLTQLAATARAQRHTGAVSYPTLNMGRHALIPGSADAPSGNLTLTKLYNQHTYVIAGGSHLSPVSSAAFIISEQ